MSDTIRDALMKAWEGRPWKDHAQNPPSMLPQLAIALGLMHPRLGGATRDMSMARGFRDSGSLGKGAFPEWPGAGTFDDIVQTPGMTRLNQLAAPPLSPANKNTNAPYLRAVELRPYD